MPNSVLWVCLVAVWLFVLVPMVIKGRPQILKSTDAARKTRLLHRGGSRATTASGSRRRSSARHPHDPSWKSSRRSATATLEKDADVETEDDADEFVDVEDAEYEDADDSEDEDAEYEDDSDDSEYEDATGELDEDEYDDYARGSRHTEAPSVIDEDDADETELDEIEDSRPTARSSSGRRSGRSIYSSETERALKYRERQRVTLGLFVLVLLAIAAGFVVGTPGWVATGMLGLLLVGYLAYLRRAVKTEQQIRAQRLARAKRSARAEEERRRRAASVPEFAAAPPPPRLRRPGGATVLEIDDEDPVFDHIPPFQRRRMDREDLQYRRVG
ncbi:divisome protein SepX/GlpR [Gordonia sp. HS-NH1]|uniref:divisome protein SepX/GlpR n=1 Tax=Gordonia sp. HS-NH1 TaxID=1435068 RepID=UPI0006E1EEA3|nr:gephyrin-like molybdotransferase receptor GlpR [Gordonia sp. HS-NH1]